MYSLKNTHTRANTCEHLQKWNESAIFSIVVCWGLLCMHGKVAGLLQLCCRKSGPLLIEREKL